ncbi:MAG TPA: carboxypeptidase regulatory-like domain-containing protein [Gemmatimonadaceae bacterium]|nr:carboxypeptidase regulatory-like domain-containing protein [Gemmatimonadaceae bacterium]
MSRFVALTLGVCALASRLAVAQGGGTISGVVRDSAAVPVRDADVSVSPGTRRARTDSTGHFVIGSLDAGKYIVKARHVGYFPVEWTIDLSRSGRTDVQLVLGTKLPTLDTVVVTAGRQCTLRDIEGFLCRRASAKGVFLDYTDIDDLNVNYTGDLFNAVDGFAVDVRPTRNGPVRVPIGRRCINTLVNGSPAAQTAVPTDPADIIAVEVYELPKDIPAEYNRYTWGKEQCSLIAYWTVNFSRAIPRMRAPLEFARNVAGR